MRPRARYNWVGNRIAGYGEPLCDEAEHTPPDNGAGG